MTYAIRNLTAAAAMLSILVIMHQTAKAQSENVRYINQRFDYSVVYPADKLVAEPESDNGDGRRFHARKGSATMLIWASFNVLDETPASIAREAPQECGGRTPSYKLTKPDLVAISCLSPAGIIFWQKTVIRGDVLTTVQITYPKSERATWDPVVRLVSASLRPGQDF